MLKPKVGILIVLTTFKGQVDGRVSVSTMGDERKQEGKITETHGKPKETISMEVKWIDSFQQKISNVHCSKEI